MRHATTSLRGCSFTSRLHMFSYLLHICPAWTSLLSWIGTCRVSQVRTAHVHVPGAGALGISDNFFAVLHLCLNWVYVGRGVVFTGRTHNWITWEHVYEEAGQSTA
jgi:hypothetical protein